LGAELICGWIAGLSGWVNIASRLRCCRIGHGWMAGQPYLLRGQRGTADRQVSPSHLHAGDVIFSVPFIPAGGTLCAA